MDWLTGENTYHTLDHCMSNDWLWVSITIILDLVIFTQYILIAYSGLKQIKHYKRGIIINTFIAFVAIFVFCAICGYLSEVVRLYWPGYRLFAILKIILMVASQIFIIYSDKISFFSKLLVQNNKLKELEDELTTLQTKIKKQAKND